MAIYFRAFSSTAGSSSSTQLVEPSGSISRRIKGINTFIRCNYERYIWLEILAPISLIDLAPKTVILAPRLLSPGEYSFDWLDFLPSEGDFIVPPNCAVWLRSHGELGINPLNQNERDDPALSLPEREQVNIYLEIEEIEETTTGGTPTPTPTPTPTNWLKYKNDWWTEGEAATYRSEIIRPIYRAQLESNDSSHIGQEKIIRFGPFTLKHQLSFWLGGYSAGSNIYIELLQMGGEGYYGMYDGQFGSDKYPSLSPYDKLHFVAINTEVSFGDTAELKIAVRPQNTPMYGRDFFLIGKEFTIV